MTNALYTYVGAFVDELARSGLTDVCICPGSRSTPLALAVARHGGINVWMHLDERSAAFFALGMAKTSRRPVALVCTSGTAVANFMPAVVEARQSRVPLLVLTADRPPELHDVGASQTIDQIRFYGSQVTWSVEMPLPEATETLLRFVRTTAGRAVAEASGVSAGPVHLNFPFREPLVPTDEPLPSLSAVALYGRLDGAPYVRVSMGGTLILDLDRFTQLADDLAREPHGLIVCGPLDEPDLAVPLADLALLLGYPILADPLSGLRCGPHDRSMVIDSYDSFLRDARFAAEHAPHLVLRFGAMPTAKPLLQYLQRYPDARQIVVDRAGWRDPTLQAAEMLHTDPVALCTALTGRYFNQPPACGADAAAVWQRDWMAAAHRTRTVLDRELAAIDEPFEGRVMSELADLLPEGATLFAGNSMPVRDVDTFFHGSERRIAIMGNRGASGIDGVTSTALGVAAASGAPVVLAIGDISFYHDLNGLLAARQYGLNLTVVLLNNDGGGIFSFLPQAAALPRLPSGSPPSRQLAGSKPARVDGTVTAPDGGDQRQETPADRREVDTFELLFGTPHGLDFSHAAALYGATYTRIDGWDGYRRAVRRGIEEGGLHIVEVRTDRDRNVELHRRLWPAVAAALAE